MTIHALPEVENMASDIDRMIASALRLRSLNRFGAICTSLHFVLLTCYNGV